MTEENFELDREVIIIVGNTGSGKSLWAKLKTRLEKKLFVYDPVASYPAKYKDKKFIDSLVDMERPTHFKVGTFDSDAAASMGSVSYVWGKNTLLLEEASTFLNKGGKIEEWLKRIIFMGRHRDCSLIMLAQRATYIPIDLRSQATRIISFRQHEEDDLDWLAGKFGKENKKFFPRLKKWECFDFEPDAENEKNIITRYSIKAAVEKELGIKLSFKHETK